MPDEPAVDSHAHVFCGPGVPFARDAVYRPHESQIGTARYFTAVLASHGLTHGLLVGAQPYGINNLCIISAIAASRGCFKGIALVRADIADRDLDRLAEQGIVGIRVNLMTDGLRGLAEPGADRLLARIREMNWFIQIHCQHDELVEAMPYLQRAGVRTMIDHFGRPNVERGLDQPGFQALLELGRTGNSVLKLSGPFRSSREGWPYTDIDGFVQAAIEAFTLDNCVWGSDWPFVRVEERIDYGPNRACLDRWLPNAADRRRVLWHTPARLFGFSA